jgi:hypothetical protein
MYILFLLQHASANSFGYFITQDSSFGNLILPVIPRFKDLWQHIYHTTAKMLSTDTPESLESKSGINYTIWMHSMIKYGTLQWICQDVKDIILGIVWSCMCGHLCNIWNSTILK